MKSMGVKTILTMIALGVGIAGYAQQSGRDLDNIVLATDNVTITVDTNNQTTKTPKTPYVDFSFEGGPLNIIVKDEQNSYQDGDWSLIAGDSNIMSLDPAIIGDIFYTNGIINDLMAGQNYNITVRVNSETNGPNGALQRITDEFDHYRSDITLYYNANGNNDSVYFRSPNSGTNFIFNFEPGEFHAVYGLSPLTQPAEFENAMINLGSLFTDPANDSTETKYDQRNANDTDWAAEKGVIIALSDDPLNQDDLYPTGIKVNMIDYSENTSSSSPPKWNYKSTSDLDFSPPINDNGPHTIDTNSVWTHSYTVPVPDENTYPSVSVTGLSDNMNFDTAYIEPTDNPLAYKVHLQLSSGDEVSEENFDVSFVGVPVGTEENTNTTLEDLALKYGPNPFSEDVNLSYILDGAYNIKINIISANGLVRSFDLGKQDRGRHNFRWAPSGDVADGFYLLEMVMFNKEGVAFQKTLSLVRK